MDKQQILNRLIAVYGAGVTFWSLGVSMVTRNVFECMTGEAGWSQALNSEWYVAALAVTIAGPVALLLRKFHLVPPRAPDQPDAPAEPSPSPDQARSDPHA